MIFLCPRRWRSPPTGAIGIDWSNPLTAGLVFWAPLHNGAALDVVNNVGPTTSVAAAYGSNRETGEPGWLFDGSTSKLQWATSSVSPHPVSLSAEYYPISAAIGVVVQVATQETTGYRWHLAAVGNPNYAGSAVSGATAATANSSFLPGSAAGNSIRNAQATFGATNNRTAYTYGQHAVTNATARTGSWGALGVSIGCTRYNATEASFFGGTIRNVAIWNRLLDPSEAASLGAEPWQFAAPRRGGFVFDYGATGAALWFGSGKTAGKRNPWTPQKGSDL